MQALSVKVCFELSERSNPAFLLFHERHQLRLAEMSRIWHGRDDWFMIAVLYVASQMR
jgi:hypothetical protein